MTMDRIAQLEAEVQRLHAELQEKDDANTELVRQLTTANATITRLRRQASGTVPADPREIEVFEYWRERIRPKGVFTPDRKRKVRARLAELDKVNPGDKAVAVATLKLAIDGAVRGAYVGDNGVRHDDLELICRNAGKVDLFVARAAAIGPGSTSSTDLRNKLAA